MACKACERRNKAMAKRAAAELERAEKLAAQGKIGPAALARARGKAIRYGAAVLSAAGKAIHGEVKDERGQEPSDAGDPDGHGAERDS